MNQDEQEGLLDASPMTRPQIGVLCITALLAILDGYDLLAMAFVAPALAQAWTLNPTTLGLLLAVSLMGMAVGSLALSPIADVIGRRPAVLAALTLMIVGSALSALAGSPLQLAAYRFVTGMGIGTMMALTTAMAAEFASVRRRTFAIASISIGLPVGSLLGGVVAALLLQSWGWPAVFFSGAIFGAVLMLLVVTYLPESPSYLIARGRPDALAQVNRVMKRLGRPLLNHLPSRPSVRRGSYKTLFAPGLARLTVSFAAVQMLLSVSAFYMVNWLPQMVKGMGFAASTGSLASAVWSFGAIAAGLSFGALAGGRRTVRLACAAMAGFGLAVGTFGFTPPIIQVVLLAATLCGFFLGGGTAVFYATVANSFPSISRVSGIGLVMGAGRVFSFAGPSLGGWMFAHGFDRGQVTLAFAIAPIIAGLVLLNAVAHRDRTLAT